MKGHFTVAVAAADLTASMLGFPGGSLGREGGRGGGGGGVGLTEEGVEGRTGEDEPAKEKCEETSLGKLLQKSFLFTDGGETIKVLQTLHAVFIKAMQKR